MSEVNKAVFLSYASQDAEAAKRLCEVLRAAGVEVWFDVEGGLETGDEWDAKIRRQIKECVLFIPIISANTQAREEGYFRIEWDLAVERARGIASGVAFILPVVIDDTKQPDALVPDRFRSVQWTKIPGGAVPPEVLQRFLKLWSHRTGVLKHEAARATEVTAATSPPVRRRVWPWMAGGLVALAVAYVAFKPRHSPEEVARVLTEAQKLASPPTAAPSAPASSSEARQLVAKAYGLLRGLEATREDFALAEEYGQRALKLDPDDGEVWAVVSQLNAAFVYRGWDATPARKEQTRVMAERAIRLAPTSVEARIAQAGAWSTFGINREEREKLLREVVRDDPTNQGALRFLAVTVLSKPDGLAECLALNERSAALPGGDPLALFNNARYLLNVGKAAEAYATLQRSIEQKPFISALILKMSIEITWRGDLTEAEETLRRLPPSALLEDRANYAAGLLRYYQRNAAGALEIWQSFPRDHYRDFIYEGPKGLLIGLAYELDHRDAAAKIEWRAALPVVEKLIATAPNKAAPYLQQAMLLACLGDKAAAGEALRTYEQLEGLKYSDQQPMPGPVARVYARLGRFDEIFAHPPGGNRNVLRVSPDFDALRADPRFARLMADTPRDWLKNPELKKAIDLIEGLNATPDDLQLAEEIARRFVERQPTDAEAVTVLARVESAFILRNWDFREERSQLAKRYAERALQLAPDEPEAHYSLGLYLMLRARDYGQAEAHFREACRLGPGEPRFWRGLAEAVMNQRAADGLKLAEENIIRFPHDALTHYNLSIQYRALGRYGEWERELDATLALAPLPNAFDWKARAAFMRGDLEDMPRWLEKIPSRLRTEERATLSSVAYAAFSGRHDYGLKALQGFTESWFRDNNNYGGPKALLKGWLYEMSGRAELARAEYEAALIEVRRRREAAPADMAVRFAEVWVLKGLQRPEEARAAFRGYLESLRRPYRVFATNLWFFEPIPASLLLGERATALQLIQEAVGQPGGRATIRLRFEMDSRMAPFRADPEIQALLAEPEATK